MYFSNLIENIVDLSAEEQKFFDNKNFVSPNFSVQTLYKVSGQIIPLRFNLAVHNMMIAEKDFRTNFLEIENKMMKVILDKNIKIPEVTYRNLSQYEDEELDDMLTKIMEADRRLTFAFQYYI